MNLKIVPDVINGQTFVMINYAQTARKGAEFMKKHDIGAVLVSRTDYSTKGILTDRDITRRLVADGLDPDKTFLEEIMTAAPMVVAPKSRVRNVLKLMREGNFRHMPVVDDNAAYGIVSVRDIYSAMLQRLQGASEKQRAKAIMQTSILPRVIDGQHLIHLPPSATVCEAASLMQHHSIGAVLVMKGEKLKGIFTERDVNFQVVAAGLSPDTTPLSKVRTKDLVTVNLDDGCEDVLQKMEARNCQHMPVFDGDRLVGVVSMRDIDNFLQIHIERRFGVSPIQRVLEPVMRRFGNNSRR